MDGLSHSASSFSLTTHTFELYQRVCSDSHNSPGPAVAFTAQGCTLYACLIASSRQIRGGKAWEILSRALTSGRLKVD